MNLILKLARIILILRMTEFAVPFPPFETSLKVFKFVYFPKDEEQVSRENFWRAKTGGKSRFVESRRHRRMDVIFLFLYIKLVSSNNPEL